MNVIPHISNRILDFFWELPAYAVLTLDAPELTKDFCGKVGFIL